MSPSSRTSPNESEHQSPQMRLGWLALAFFVVAAVMALLKVDVGGFACVALGGIVSVVALALELRQRRLIRQAIARGEEQIFPEAGTFGARRSPQTHNKMI